MGKDIYTIEINSTEFKAAEVVDGIYTLDMMGRFPNLVGKAVIVKPNFWQFAGNVTETTNIRPEGGFAIGVVTSTAGGAITTIPQLILSQSYLVRSNLFNEKSFTKSGASSTILMPVSSAPSLYNYSFEAVLPSVLNVSFHQCKQETNAVATETVVPFTNKQRLVVSFTIMEKD